MIRPSQNPGTSVRGMTDDQSILSHSSADAVIAKQARRKIPKDFILNTILIEMNLENNSIESLYL
jgi:hypothetical protein